MKFVLFITLSVLTFSSFAQNPKRIIKKLGSDPVYFIDSVNVDKSEILKYQPTQIAAVTVYKPGEAIDLLGPDGKDGAIYIETIVFSKNKYWNYFKTKSADYAKIILTPESDTAVQYILNERILTKDFEGNLASISDSIFKGLRVIDKATLKKEYKITGKAYGIVIKSDKPDNLYKARKKF